MKGNRDLLLTGGSPATLVERRKRFEEYLEQPVRGKGQASFGSCSGKNHE